MVSEPEDIDFSQEESKETGKNGLQSEETTPLQNNSTHSEKKEPSAESSRIPKTVTISDVELEQLKKDLSECKDKYLRTLAESENARKRLQKEKQDMIQYALQNLVVDFLTPIDHLENALKFTQQMSDDVKHWAKGFQMILQQFKDVLTMNGATPFVSEGKPFDPHRHEAVETVTTADFPPGTVVEESVRGYLMGERTIRPARVKVSKAPAPEEKDQPMNNEIIKN